MALLRIVGSNIWLQFLQSDAIFALRLSIQKCREGSLSFLCGGGGTAVSSSLAA